jgi:hypothetical protein
MIVRSAKLVVHHEEGESTVILSDLRKFLDVTADAADGDVKIETGVLYDGAPADVLYVQWVQR